MMQKLILLISLFFALFFSACNTQQEKDASFKESTFTGTVVADTIIYPVNVLNLDSADEWTSRRLRNVNHQKLTNLLFKAVYEGKAKDLDYYTRETISSEKIREMEESGKIDRDQMAQLQFEETWQIDPAEGKMIKQVQSVLLAWPVFDSKGNFQAYQAGFVIKLTQ
jgi:hypothetical protein